ncbi:MAG: alkaline phosphatase family protein [Bacteroidia bacterium]
MIFRNLLVLCALFLPFSSNAQSTQKRVVMISLDGAPDYLIDQFLANGVLPANGAFARIRKSGAYAETMLPINVASTGPSHVSIFTGASPGKTGIVGNTFRKVDQPWESKSLTAFKEPILAETIFQAAMRQGKKVMTLAGVGIDQSSKARMTDYMFTYPNIVGPSLVLDLEVTDTITSEGYRKLKTSATSASKPVYEVTGSFQTPLYFYLTSPTGKTGRSKEIVVDTDSVLGNGYAALVSAEDWVRMEMDKGGRRYNSSFRIFKADDKVGKYQLFMNAPAEIIGSPSEFIKKLQSACGLWPGEPENIKQTAGLVPEKIWFEQLDRLASYSKSLILTGIKEKDWDLLFGYFSTLDDVQHRYTLTDPRQIDFTADNGNRPKIYDGYIQKYFKRIDSYLLEIMNALPKGTNLVVFSDHGMVPAHTTLMLNNYIEEAGFNELNQYINAASSGNSAHLYINKDKVKAGDYDAYLKGLTDSLKTLRDPKTGELIFDLVANQEQQKAYGLYHQDFSGDLFVSCKSGYTLSARYVPGVKYLLQHSFDPKMYAHENQATRNFLLGGGMNETGRAVHGSLSSLRKSQSIFYAIGPDVPHKQLREIYSLQIAATVSALLGIEPPKDAEMKSAF